jgi:hypothetical protein
MLKPAAAPAIALSSLWTDHYGAGPSSSAGVPPESLSFWMLDVVEARGLRAYVKIVRTNDWSVWRGHEKIFHGRATSLTEGFALAEAAFLSQVSAHQRLAITIRAEPATA